MTRWLQASARPVEGAHPAESAERNALQAFLVNGQGIVDQLFSGLDGQLLAVD
jgi:hypothetical protein